MKKPEKLYRGIKLDFDKLVNFDFNGNIELPILYKFHENGMKLVSDGNEYGIYMTDNIQMPLCAYGNSSIYDGVALDDTIRFGIGKDVVRIPPVCIIYEIDTKEIDIKEPWICPELRGHYNNGFSGKEWITQSAISAKSYNFALIKIGEDYLHSEEIIKLKPNDNIKEILIEKYTERNQRLNTFLDALKTIDPKRRLRIDSDIRRIQSIYKKDGIAYKKPSEIKITDAKSLKDKLICRQLNSHGFDFDKIKSIETLFSKINDNNIYEILTISLSNRFKNTAIEALNLLVEEDLKKIGVSYCHFSNNNAHIIFDNYNIKLSYDGNLNITQFDKTVNLEELLLDNDNVRKIVNILENLRIEKGMSNIEKINDNLVK